ncbi:hypothetical protein DNU06_08235 [Putridiphycobacter roseus]|uniref:WG repeat-containing protein n=1 Tax=Putridiphycobacter roseus TaxID=2219161 RepID=A0A2W1NNN3_9FLAO|nr:WG repeat-containing protein [Putridiphycobacter roseus]PZE17252.1 hypothetical protein DNU06_08235 [Putridiphycobacter roseus]
MVKKVFIVLFFICLGNSAEAGGIGSGFKALEIYNYFKAKKYFEKSMKRHPVAASYGLGVIYQRKDNPFYQLDSAYKYANYASKHFKDISDKTQIKYAKYGVDSVAIFKLRDQVAEDMFERAVLVNSEFGFQDFMDKNPWSDLVKMASFYRDSLFYETVYATHTAASFLSFLKKYPHSLFAPDAKDKYEQQLYIEQTKREDVNTYAKFIEDYPNSPFRVDAENRIFDLTTKDNSIRAFENFIEQYPNNSNVAKAWINLYDTYLAENSDKNTSNALAAFLSKYPNNPMREIIEEELRYASIRFYPIQHKGKWGFTTMEGNFSIPCKYDFVELFQEGLAAVTQDGKVGYIEKSGKVKIDFQYEEGLGFNEGTAVVEIDEQYGLINRQGKYIVSPELSYLGTMTEGLVPFEKNEHYGYFNRKGETVIAPTYADAFNFHAGYAKVELGDKLGVIDQENNFLIPAIYYSISSIKDSVFALENEENWGVISNFKDTILPFEYTYIGPLSQGFFIVTKNDSFNYSNILGQLLLKKSIPVYREYKVMAQYTGDPILYLNENGYNFIEINGKQIFKKQKDNLGTFSDIVAFELDGKWGYLSVNPPKEVIKPQFDNAQSFKNGLGIVSLSPLWGMIDTKGQFLIPAYYESLTFLNENIILAEGKGKTGLLSLQGDTLLDFKVQEIELFEDNWVLISNSNNTYYYNLETKAYLRKEND